MVDSLHVRVASQKRAPFPAGLRGAFWPIGPHGEQLVTRLARLGFSRACFIAGAKEVAEKGKFLCELFLEPSLRG